MMTADAPPGLLTVLSGPSGVGKTTIVHAAQARFDGVFSISATTRPKSGQERDGIDYLFIDEPRFEAMIAENAFLEHAKVFDRHWYGTPRGPIDEALRRGKVVLLDIDVQGALQVRKHMPEAFLAFVLPPNDEALAERLRARGRDDDEAMARRLREAQREIALARESGAYDAFIVNDDLDRAKEEMCRLIEARRAASAGVARNG